MGPRLMVKLVNSKQRALDILDDALKPAVQPDNPSTALNSEACWASLIFFTLL